MEIVPRFVPEQLFPLHNSTSPLDDVEALELQSGDSGGVHTAESQEQEQIPEPEYQPPAQSTIEIPNTDEPNFDDFSANEYDDFDLDLSEEDAMLEALNDLGYTDKKKGKK